MKRERSTSGGPDLADPGVLDIEHALGRLAKTPVPPGLRARVLGQAAAERRSAALSPGLRFTTAGCSLLIAAVLVLDPLAARREAARLASLLDGRAAAAEAYGPASELALELDIGASAAERLAHLQALASSRSGKEIPEKFFQAREWLKGWLDHETSENPD
jgi:hypothetical protein